MSTFSSPKQSATEVAGELLELLLGQQRWGDGHGNLGTSQGAWTAGEVQEQDEALIRFQKIGGVIHFGSKVEILPSAAAVAELPWLVPLGWYLTIKMRDDAGGWAAAAG